MKKGLLVTILTAALLLIPVNMFANDHISEGDMNPGDEILTLGHYDAVTKTETIETVSLSELKAQNEAMKAKLGLTGQNVLNGYDPTSGTSTASMGEDGAAPQTLFGDYTQSKVNVNNYPYRCVMFLRLGTDKDGDGVIDLWGNGSGFLVGNNVMVTAAHCFVTKVNGKNTFIDQCRIYPLQSSGSYSSTNYYLPKNWTYSTVYMESENVEHDWIVASLFNSLGSEHGYFAVRDWSASIAGVTAAVSGYPSETTEKKYYQYCSSGPLKSYTTKRMSYLMDTEGGNSGCPVYVSGNQVIGIHTGGGTQANWALRIFEALYTVIENMRLSG